MTTAREGAIVLFTRDLRVHDHPGLDEVSRRFDRVAPLFVFDDRVLRDQGTPNRVSFLLDALHDLRDSLRKRGADLVVRRGDVVAETLRLARETGCTSVYVGSDASSRAREREARLARECRRERLELCIVDTVAVVPPGGLRPADTDHYRVFTAYWRRWRDLGLRSPLLPPGRLRLVDGLPAGEIPTLPELATRACSPSLPQGGERAARSRLARWLANGLERYAAESDSLAADATSRLSPYLHFGCVSALEVVERTRRHEGAEPFVRQLCWRDFFLQLLAANPSTPREDLRDGPADWRDDAEALERWRTGQTGYPIVDAAMRQLAHEGWLPNRARLVAASFLTRTLGIDWRLGAQVFFDLLVDGDVANNVGNWQWVAGTGANARPNRVLNPLRQAARFDPQGEYVRRHVPELEALPGAAIHEPWQAADSLLAPEYPERIAAHAA